MNQHPRIARSAIEVETEAEELELLEAGRTGWDRFQYDTSEADIPLFDKCAMITAGIMTGAERDAEEVVVRRVHKRRH